MLNDLVGGGLHEHWEYDGGPQQEHRAHMPSAQNPALGIATGLNSLRALLEVQAVDQLNLNDDLAFDVLAFSRSAIMGIASCKFTMRGTALCCVQA
jgi:hypothetical protein